MKRFLKKSDPPPQKNPWFRPCNNIQFVKRNDKSKNNKSKNMPNRNPKFIFGLKNIKSYQNKHFPKNSKTYYPLDQTNNKFHWPLSGWAIDTNFHIISSTVYNKLRIHDDDEVQRCLQIAMDTADYIEITRLKNKTFLMKLICSFKLKSKVVQWLLY